MRKQTKRQSNQQKEAGATLGDILNADLLNQLKNKQRELKESEIKKQEEEEARKREERRQKEKNKSFEELFNESSMDWKKYK